MLVCRRATTHDADPLAKARGERRFMETSDTMRSSAGFETLKATDGGAGRSNCAKFTSTPSRVGGETTRCG
jgi:hypothetical protein